MMAEPLMRQLVEARHPIPIFKEAIAANQASLAERFWEGEPVNALLRERADFMDQVMQAAWQRFNWSENLRSWRKTRISLLAVGGYGRAELHPASDIDLLILLERGSYDLHAANVQSFLTLMWDIGLEVGHSVRSVKECANQARADVTILTALIEARTLCGDDELRELMEKRIAPGKMWSAKKFYEAKRAEQDERHRKSDHTEYSLEPNVKTSPGGLRDVQTIVWIARRRFGTVDFASLVSEQFLTAAEASAITEGRNFLSEIRYGLHLVAGREDDRLLFEYQPQLASRFGYTDGDQLAVEQFMQDYYRTAHELNALNELILQHFDEHFLGRGHRARLQAINERFQTRDNYLEVTSDRVFEDYPPALLEMFVILGSSDHLLGVRASTIRLVRDHVRLIDDEFRNNPDATDFFMQLLGVSHHLFSQLRRMARYGILGAYLPEFERVIGQMQFDLFHIYTVDAHTLQVVRNMRRFRYKNQEQRFPIAAHIHARLPKLELLYVAGLYHDIAKGQGGDHSELGIEVARKFCERHRLGTWDTNLVCWLVKNHLVMSTTAQRKDISDPEIIFEFAQLVQDQVRLDYLYALTVADINATNPTLWNSFRASLMSQLYLETKRMLRQGAETEVDRHEYIQENREHALERLSEHGISADMAWAIWDMPDEDYFLRESVNDVVWHTEAIVRQNEQGQTGPLVLVRNESSTRRADEGATHIFVHTEYSREIFYLIVTALDQQNLNIVDARIPGSDNNRTYYTFVVLAADGHPVADEARMERIRTALTRALLDADITPTTRRTPRMLKQFKLKTEVRFSQNEIADCTMLEVVAADRPGLLSILAQVFIDTGIYLQNARITTLGERVEDVFMITDVDGNPVTDQAHLDRIREAIKRELDHHVEKVAV